MREHLPPISWINFDTAAKLEEEDFFRIPIFKYDPNNILEFETIGSAQVIGRNQHIEVR